VNHRPSFFRTSRRQPFGRIEQELLGVVGVTALFFAVYGFMVAGNTPPNTFGISNLESLADDVLHLFVGVWALAAAFLPRGRMLTAAGT
jgi:hypothetical protein